MMEALESAARGPRAVQGDNQCSKLGPLAEKG